jgi:5'-nucleotidase/UDP-sugar diphosphatase
MKHFKKLLFCFLAFVFAVTALLPAAFAAGGEKAVKLLFTHDLHAAFLPAKTAGEDGSVVESGGYARLSSAIKSEREKNPEGTLLLDAGDYSMGTLFQTLYTKENLDLRILGKMGYDAVTAGNHEFDYTITGFAASLEAAKKSGDPLPAYVMSNIKLPVGDPKTDALKTAMQDYGVKEYKVIEKNGVRVGIFGLMGKEAASFAPEAKPAVFEDIAEAAKRMVKILKDQEKVDLVVCLSHSGTKKDLSESEDEQLAKAAPGIDVIISGHTHTVLPRPIIVGSTVIASCGANSAYLGVLDLVYDGGWKVQSYGLTEINEEIPDDPEIASTVEAYKKKIDAYLEPYGLKYDQVIASSSYQFTDNQYMFDHPAEYTLGNLLADSFVYAVKQAEGENYEPVDVTVVPVGTIRATFNKGDISVADAFKVLSLGTGPDGLTGYPLISVYLKGSELKNVCEVDASIAGLMGDAQLYMSGIRFTYNPNRLIFNKVTDAVMVKEDGSTEKIQDDRTYRVVCGLYSGQMLAVVKSKSFGILSLTPKARDGGEVTDFSKQIIYADKDGKQQEIKEWQALSEYLQSFEKEGGVSAIPAKYADIEGRKAAEDSGDIIDIVKNPNGFALIALAVVLVILALLVLIPVWIVKGAKKRRKKKLAVN